MRRLVFLCLLLGLLASSCLIAATDPVAAKPLFRDPVFDGAADPVVVWNPTVQRWWMFYTNRRANAAGLSGVAWVHGTKIGIAESADGGAHWSYVGTADLTLPPDLGGTEPTHWAPEVVTAPDGTHHMFLTVVPGVFEDWNHPRRIVHLTSTDLRKWNYESVLDLASDRVIDAAVHPLPGGGWRMWYNNERDRKSISYADSPDLKAWKDQGKCAGVGERPGEGPYVFHWRGAYWMLVDLWQGLGVYRSDDLLHWTAQTDNLLGVPGTGADDGVNGGHPGVVVSGDRAYLFYFTHPGRAGTIKPDDNNSPNLRRSSIQVTELVEKDGILGCDRNAPVAIKLLPPATAAASAYAIGADLSFLRQAEAHGVKFKDGGVAKPGLQIFKDHGYNWVRLRLFHTPGTQAHPLPNDLAYTISLAQDARALGLKFLLDFHYSDTWADPTKQFLPQAWAAKTHAELVTAVHDYTRDSIAAFRAAGVLPDMVQIGNEVTPGLLWPDGRLPENWNNFADLLQAGIAGVDAGRGDAPRPRIMIHIERSGDRERTRWFFDNLLQRGVPFDVIGQSYYPWWHGSLLELRDTLHFMAETYRKDIILVEVAYNWRPTEYLAGPPPFPETPEGQRDFLAAVHELVLATPHGLGKGVFWWEPAVEPRTRIASRGMFDPEGNALPVLSVFDRWTRGKPVKPLPVSP